MQFVKAFALFGLLSISNFAVAGEHSEKLSKCLTSSITPEDQTALVRWIFGAVANHPDVADIANLTPAKWDEISKNGAFVFEKLIADKCASESRSAIINDGMAGYKSAFETLGSTAVGGLMTDPAVAKAMEDLQKYLSEEKLMKALMTGTPQSN
ncbi:hypothetical protein [Thermomonas sp. HDW16]|uniref:hypothetical protein n=1 Tax=Thermomonas sp. HDW16 TaxID=2714945 RepID=UPI001409F5D1|nr:hypothetical protein [Thermomonas sp. HDW16]QIL21082.1 hypothetical protein G7079_10280 [Thermomonas sp. HDW16]